MTTGTLHPALKPKLRGVLHQWAFFGSLLAGVLIVVSAPTDRARAAVTVYAASVAALFGASALYHRVDWRSVAARRWMRRLDHSMIFVLIAGTYTPFALLALDGAFALTILIAVWAGALGGIVLKLVWLDAPRWLAVALYLLLGWVATVAFPALWMALGALPASLLAAGGVLYTLGALVYALRRPDPAPAVFGFHEIFHALVVLAAALQYAVVALYVLPVAT